MIKATHFCKSTSPYYELMKEQIEKSGIRDLITLDTIIFDICPENIDDYKLNKDANHIIVFEDELGVFLTIEGEVSAETLEFVAGAISNIWNKE